MFLFLKSLLFRNLIIFALLFNSFIPAISFADNGNGIGITLNRSIVSNRVPYNSTLTINNSLSGFQQFPNGSSFQYAELKCTLPLNVVVPQESLAILNSLGASSTIDNSNGITTIYIDITAMIQSRINQLGNLDLSTPLVIPLTVALNTNSNQVYFDGGNCYFWIKVGDDNYSYPSNALLIDMFVPTPSPYTNTNTITITNINSNTYSDGSSG